MTPSDKALRRGGGREAGGSDKLETRAWPRLAGLPTGVESVAGFRRWRREEVAHGPAGEAGIGLLPPRRRPGWGVGT